MKSSLRCIAIVSLLGLMNSAHRVDADESEDVAEAIERKIVTLNRQLMVLGKEQEKLEKEKGKLHTDLRNEIRSEEPFSGTVRQMYLTWEFFIVVGHSSSPPPDGRAVITLSGGEKLNCKITGEGVGPSYRFVIEPETPLSEGIHLGSRVVISRLDPAKKAKTQVDTDKGDAVQPATAVDSKAEGRKKTEPESESRSQ